MFQIKSFLAITASMINRMRATTQKISDYNVGSVARVMIEAPAQEIDELYQQMVAALKAAIPVATYNSFSFGLLAATAASGTIRVTITPSATAITIAAGTTFIPASGGTINFVSDADFTIPAGNSYVDVTVYANATGAAGNLLAQNTFTVNAAPPGFVSAINLANFQNGTDTETEPQRLARFQSYIVSLARSPDAGIKYGASQGSVLNAAGIVIERVQLCDINTPWLTDPTQPVSLFNIWIHNGVGGTSSLLVQATQQIIDGYYDVNKNPVPGYKAAGTKAVVQAAVDTPVPVTGVLTLTSTTSQATAIAAAESALANYTLSLSVKQPWIAAAASAAVMAVQGVTDFVVSVGNVDLPAVVGAKYLIGALNITANGGTLP